MDINDDLQLDIGFFFVSKFVRRRHTVVPGEPVIVPLTIIPFANIDPKKEITVCLDSQGSVMSEGKREINE